MMSAPISKQALLAKLHQLPSLPLIVQEVIASFNDPDMDTTSLAAKIAQDQGLSAKVLRVANSSFYGLPRKVGSIQDALVVLGFACVRSMALSTGMAQAFPASASSTFDRNSYWQRSFRVAAIAKSLAKNLRKSEQLAFTAGMFYDIGQLVLDLCIPQKFTELVQQQAGSGLSLLEIEQVELGFDHAEIGAELVKMWNFPTEIEQVVRDWRHPELQDVPLVDIVHIAALLEGGLRGEELMGKLPANLGSRLSLSWERIEDCLPSDEQLDAAASLAQA
jgi:HD-like signal output (HDOD) protein